MKTKAKKLKLGAHMSAAGGLENAITIAVNAGCQTLQLFSANQRQWKAKKLTSEQVDIFKQTYAESGLEELVVHASYLINLAAINEETLQKSLVALGEELDRCDQLGIHYLVLHPGAHMKAGVDAGIKMVINSLNHVYKKDWNCQLLLETTAGQGSCLGCEFEELAKIRAGLKKPTQVGVCLDTCHVFAAGYDLTTKTGYQKTLREFENTIGIEHLKVVHVNDSKTPLGSRVDRHDHIGKGKLTQAAFKHLMTDNRITRLPLILETPKGTSPGGRDYDKLNLATLRRLAQ
jgi:deoxyribonuclease-4